MYTFYLFTAPSDPVSVSVYPLSGSVPELNGKPSFSQKPTAAPAPILSSVSVEILDLKDTRSTLPFVALRQFPFPETVNTGVLLRLGSFLFYPCYTFLYFAGEVEGVVSS